MERERIGEKNARNFDPKFSWKARQQLTPISKKGHNIASCENLEVGRFISRTAHFCSRVRYFSPSRMSFYDLKQLDSFQWSSNYYQITPSLEQNLIIRSDGLFLSFWRPIFEIRRALKTTQEINSIWIRDFGTRNHFTDWDPRRKRSKLQAEKTEQEAKQIMRRTAPKLRHTASSEISTVHSIPFWKLNFDAQTFGGRKWL